MKKNSFSADFSRYLVNIDGQFDVIPEERKALLEELGHYIHDKGKSGKTCNLVFICTHNSRRSQMSQIFAHAASIAYNRKFVRVFSGGTEATAFNPNAILALREAGLQIKAESTGKNPRYRIITGEPDPGILCYSKTFDEVCDNLEDFAAVMTCSEADEACPYIPGAEKRYPVRYEDPGQFDGTEEQDQAYRDTCRIIARQMFYLFSKSA